MPKGLYIYRCVFSFFLSTPNLRGHWTISTKRGHWTSYLLMTAIWKIWSELTRAFIPTVCGKKALFVTDFELWPNISRSVSVTEHDINNRKETCHSIYRDSPICPPNLVNFGPETAENGWRAFAHPLFALEILPAAWTLYNRQHSAGKFWHVLGLCSGTTLQCRTTESRAGSRWALPCI